ncbi:sulfurtransferase-like selenium metabolism protein YedF [Anaeroselena agilis]|uniref:Sulfurtransferase-like selenium metabolism protein YedF n=1 Tax=Anaeroselena agilis TaxID=3063788 RepID=A0ABU3P2P6_9FIRM|nr:sulfurtransferase-like selenium metabolism protein YedF [Selenomonadales bacterium 4137-cl]
MSTDIDARGLACPQPVIATKKALDAMAEGVVTTFVDNLAAKENVVKFAVASGCGVSVQEQDGHYRIRITKGAPAAAQGNSAGEAAVCPAGETVYLITKDTFGHGSDDLGAILMKSFFFTVRESEPLPKAILFVNGGVRLAVAGSPVLDHLGALAAAGVTVLSCGTCLDFFGLKDQLAVGGVTNMYSILDQLAAGKAVTL